MSKGDNVRYLSVVILLLFLSSSNTFAVVKMTSSPSPGKKLRFSVNETYLASFETILRGEEINFSRVNKMLGKHFSKILQGKEVSGVIWENIDEPVKEIIIIIFNKNNYLGKIMITENAFTKRSNFYYPIMCLSRTLSEALGKTISLRGVREKGNSNRPNFTITQNAWVVLNVK